MFVIMDFHGFPTTGHLPLRLHQARAFARHLQEQGTVQARALAHRDAKAYREMCRDDLAEGRLQVRHGPLDDLQAFSATALGNRLLSRSEFWA